MSAEEPQSLSTTGLSALPSVRARVLAFLAIMVAGACGAVIGWAIADLQCTRPCTVGKGVSATVGGASAAGGVAVVSVLTLRAMGEWQRTVAQDSSTRRNPSA